MPCVIGMFRKYSINNHNFGEVLYMFHKLVTILAKCCKSYINCSQVRQSVTQVPYKFHKLVSILAKCYKNYINCFKILAKFYKSFINCLQFGQNVIQVP